MRARGIFDFYPSYNVSLTAFKNDKSEQCTEIEGSQRLVETQQPGTVVTWDTFLDEDLHLLATTNSFFDIFLDVEVPVGVDRRAKLYFECKEHGKAQGQLCGGTLDEPCRKHHECVDDKLNKCDFGTDEHCYGRCVKVDTCPDLPLRDFVNLHGLGDVRRNITTVVAEKPTLVKVPANCENLTLITRPQPNQPFARVSAVAYRNLAPKGCGKIVGSERLMNSYEIEPRRAYYDSFLGDFHLLSEADSFFDVFIELTLLQGDSARVVFRCRGDNEEPKGQTCDVNAKGLPDCEPGYHCVEDKLNPANLGICLPAEYPQCNHIGGSCGEHHRKLCIQDPACPTGQCPGICVESCSWWKECKEPFECVLDPSCPPRNIFDPFQPRCPKVCLYEEQGQ